MTTLAYEDIKCSHCGAVAEQLGCNSTNEFGAPDLDLRPGEMLRSTMHTWMQSCVSCGYVAASLDTPLGADAPIIARVIASKEYNDARYQPNFITRALIEEACGRLTRAAEQYLRAAWTMDDAASASRAAELRSHAADLMAAAIKASDAWREDFPAMEFVLIDVLRRAGRWAEADAQAERMVASAPDAITKNVVLLERRQIAARDQAACSVADVDRQAAE